MKDLFVVIPGEDPLIPLLEQCADGRGITAETPEKRRKKLPKLARTLIQERLSELKKHGDPLTVETAGSDKG